MRKFQKKKITIETIFALWHWFFDDNRFLIYSYYYKKYFKKRVKFYHKRYFDQQHLAFINLNFFEGKHLEFSVRLLMFFLKNKTECIYKKVQKKLKEMFLIKQNFIICEFEIDLINEIKKNLKERELYECLFHFFSAFWGNYKI